MSTHNGTESPGERAVCPCGLALGDRRNGSAPAARANPTASADHAEPGSPVRRGLGDTPADLVGAIPESAVPRWDTAVSGTRRFRLRTGDTVIEIEWDAPPGAPSPDHAGYAEATATEVPGSVPGHGAKEPREDTALYVRAPMVGTFYHAPDAGTRPFVGVGDIVQPGQTIGILEVMKMMNPVTADIAGRVVDMVAADAQPVEYDQPLIALEPLGSG